MEYNNTSNNFGNNLSSSSFFKQGGMKFRPNSLIYESELQMKIPESINYSNQFMKNEDWENISKLLTDNSNITAIDLSGININDVGLKMLGEVVKQNSCVTTLKLQWNYLNEHSTEFDYFCECVSRSKLVYIYLNNDKINNSHCSSIGKIIKNSTSMLYIDLRWNEIGNDGAKTLISSLLKNCSIQELNIVGNKISDENLKEISDCLSKNKIKMNSAYNINNEEAFNTATKSISKSPERENTLNINRDNENVPLKFLEKEKELSDEFKARYDVQLITNAKIEKRNKELEMILNIERNKVTEAKDNFEKELEEERNFRVKYEEQVLSFKEEVMRINLEKSKLENDFDVKSVAFNNENNNLKNETKSLKESLDRLTSFYEHKFSLLKEEYDKNSEHLNDNIDNLKEENEKTRREMSEEIKINMKEYEKKYKLLEDTYRNVKLSKDEVERNNLQLKKEMLDLKLETEIKLKENESKCNEFESKKNESMINNYENRIKVLETTKEEYSERIDSLIQEINLLKKSSSEEQISFENKLNLLNIEKLNLSKNNSVSISEQNKLSLELNTKNAIISKLEHKIKDLQKVLEESTKKSSDHLADMEHERMNDNTKYEKEKKGYSLKIEDLEKTILQLKNKLAKLESDDIKFSESFKSSIFKLIDKY